MVILPPTLLEIFQKIYFSELHKVFTSEGFRKSPVILSVSGGKDSSLALLFYYYLSTQISGLKVQMFYLDHSFRDTSEDRSVLQKQKELTGFPLEVVKKELIPLSRRLKKGWEETGRLFRYNELQKRLKSLQGPAYVATGHHTEDYLESVILHASRGGGRSALETLPPFSRYPVARFLPLVFLNDQELKSARDSLQMIFPISEDPSNSSTEFKRNRIRRITPTLRYEGLSPYHLYWNFHEPELTEFGLFLEDKDRKESPPYLRIPHQTWVFASALQKRYLLERHLHILQIPFLSKKAFGELMEQSKASRESLQLQTKHLLIIKSKKGDLWLIPVRSGLWKPFVGKFSMDSIEVTWIGKTIVWKREVGSVLRLANSKDRIQKGTISKDLYTLFQEKDIPPILRDKIPVLESDGKVLYVGLDFFSP